jgi:transposase
MIPSDEPVRLLSAVLEELDYRKLTATYSCIGRIEYSPRLLFKVVLYACTRGIYSSREIERACRENVNFMYLLEGQRAPDHNTIARFRSQHLPDAVEDLLYQMVQILVKHGEISFEESAVFIDGTKIEANANRYQFVWKRAVSKKQEKLGEKIQQELPVLLAKVGVPAPKQITVQRLKKLRKQLYAKAEAENTVFVYGKGHRKSVLQKAIEAINEWLERLKRYNLDLHICGERNSYCKTDHDATFMRMKEDHMKNGQLKPGYNVNVATVSEYIIGNYISSDRTDTKTFIPFMEKLCKRHPVKRVVVDSGYESEESYHYADGNEQLSLFVKPADHEQKKKKKYKNDIGRRENMAYDAEKDEYTCAQGKKLAAVATTKRKSETGYQQEVTIYECADCKGCPVNKCIRQKKTDKTPLEDRKKRLNVSKYFAMQRSAMEQKISTEEGILLRVNRSIQAEGTFAMVKEDMNFRRFMMRGQRNVTVEWHLISMAYNIMKLHHKIQTGRLGSHLVVPKTA